MCLFGMLYLSEEIDFPFKSLETWNHRSCWKKCWFSCCWTAGSSKTAFTWSNKAFSNHDSSVLLLALCSFHLILLDSVWVNHGSHHVYWFKVFNSNHHIKKIGFFFFFVRAACSSQLQLRSTPSGSGSKLALRQLCWRSVLSDSTSKDVVLRKEAKQRLLWMWTSETCGVRRVICFLLASRKQKGTTWRLPHGQAPIWRLQPWNSIHL